jgi:hypothetical protein
MSKVAIYNRQTLIDFIFWAISDGTYNDNLSFRDNLEYLYHDLTEDEVKDLERRYKANIVNKCIKENM